MKNVGIDELPGTLRYFSKMRGREGRESQLCLPTPVAHLRGKKPVVVADLGFQLLFRSCARNPF